MKHQKVKLNGEQAEVFEADIMVVKTGRLLSIMPDIEIDYDNFGVNEFIVKKGKNHIELIPFDDEEDR